MPFPPSPCHPEEARKTSGIIPLRNGYRFLWILSNSDEVYGSVEKPDGSLLSKSGGWYRTDDPKKAAEYAALLIS